MLAVYLGIYIFLLTILWGFFLVARHHAYKFKRFSTNIAPITNILLISLVILSILGVFAIFSLGEDTKVVKIDNSVKPIQNYY